MKIIPLTLVASLAAVATAHASLYPIGAIPDGSPTGVSFVGTYDGAPVGSTVSSLTMSLNISGGFNGDLYAYLVSPNGTLVMLMNQPGVSLNGIGSSGAGMNITLQDGLSDHGSIQDVTSSSFMTGSYNAAGSLANFNGSPADGNWTLYFADMANGGGTSLVEGWSLNITAVPEPVNLSLAIFGGVFGILALASGASGYLTKNASLAQLVQAIRAIHAGQRYVPPELARRLPLRLEGFAISQKNVESG